MTAGPLDPKTADALARVSGLLAPTVQQLAAQAKANQERLNGCVGHTWHPCKGGEMLLDRPRHYVCAECGGRADAVAVWWFLKGYAQAVAAPDHVAMATAMLDEAMSAMPLPAAAFT